MWQLLASIIWWCLKGLQTVLFVPYDEHFRTALFLFIVRMQWTIPYLLAIISYYFCQSLFCWLFLTRSFYYVYHIGYCLYVCVVKIPIVIQSRPLVKHGIMQFDRGIPNVLLTHKKNFTAVIIGYISIRCYDVW